MLYVIQVSMGKEMEMAELCRKCLTASSYDELFVPRYVAKRRYQGAWHDLLKGLLPGCVFIVTDGIKDVYQQLKRFPNAMKLLKGDHEFHLLCPEEEAFFRSVLDEHYVIQMSQGLIIGEEIWITSGVLKQHKSKIRKIDRHKRLAFLSVNLFGREMPMEVGLEVIQKISAGDFEKWKKEKQKNRAEEEKQDGMEIVLIKSGIFEGVMGKVLSKKGKVVTIGVSMMGSEAWVELGQEKVEKIC